ncbi:MAG: YbaK/EbsC family protein [Acidobacteriota bacterium]
MNEDSIESRVRAVVDFLGVPYEIMPCDPDFADTAQFCERYGIPLDHSANTIVVASKKEPKQYAACLVLADSRLDVNHAVSEAMGIRRLSFASAEETTALTGMLVGGVTVFGLPPQIPILIDSRVMDQDYVILGGGNRSTKVKMPPQGLLDMAEARVIEGLAARRES